MGYSCLKPMSCCFSRHWKKPVLDQAARSGWRGRGRGDSKYQHSEQPAAVAQEVRRRWPHGIFQSKFRSMSDFIGAFDVTVESDRLRIRAASLCWNGIATRHSDTMDCKFFVDGKGVVLGLAHPGFGPVCRARQAGTSAIAKQAILP